MFFQTSKDNETCLLSLVLCDIILFFDMYGLICLIVLLFSLLIDDDTSAERLKNLLKVTLLVSAEPGPHPASRTCKATLLVTPLEGSVLPITFLSE